MLYLFDGHNILHAGDFANERELVDALAGFVALQGARGVVVFDDATSSFGYVQPERDAEPIELSPEPNWQRVAYSRR